jgi:hypothetical protein
MFNLKVRKISGKILKLEKKSGFFLKKNGSELLWS